ncbi:hypothetical protein AGMMS50267_03820 [Spirochaetia bacterium]|nr:hypothetical protein AGMMS50267_03820 [Spirochaetia bacterium]
MEEQPQTERQKPTGKHRPVDIANSINRRIEQLMPVLTPGGIVLGLLLPGVFITLRPWIPWLFGVMTLSGALKLRFRDLGIAVSNPLPVLIFFVFAHVVMPAGVFFAGRLFFGAEPDIIAGYVLLFSAPTAVSGFIWIAMYRGDTALSLALILIDTLLAPLVVPATVALLLGTAVALDMSGIAVSLVLMVVVPTILGVTLNETSRGNIPRIISPWLGPVSKLCLTLVVAANAAAAAGQIHPTDPTVWLVAALCIIFSLAGFSGSRLAGHLAGFKEETKITLFFAGGMRNISAAATLAIAFFPEKTALPAILGILFQQTLAALVGKVGGQKKFNHKPTTGSTTQIEEI